MSSATIITGASSGIGRELSIQLAASGGTLYLLGQDEERLMDVAERVCEEGGIPITHACDVTEFDAIEEWYRSLTAEGVEVEALYHCVGRNTFGEVVNLSMDDLEWVYETNLLATVHWFSMIYPGMVERGSGTIVLLSSLTAFTGFPMASSYAATKQAALALVRSVWPEAEEAGINLHIVCPGFVRTRIFEASRYRRFSLDELMKRIDETGFSMMPADQAASLILRGVNSGRRVMVFPFYAKVMAMLGFRAPWVVDVFHRRMNRVQAKVSGGLSESSKVESFAGKVCVVTGVGSGIGKALVLDLLAEGAKVYGIDFCERRLEQLQSEVPEGATFKMLVADVRKRDEMEASAERVHREEGRVDVLINNAGVTLIEETVNVSFAEWRRVMDVNCLGVFHGVHYFYPAMVKRGEGYIVNIASIAGHSGYATAQAYATSKAAVIGFTRSLELEARQHGVRVSCVFPSYVETSIFEDAIDEGWSTERIRATFMTPPIPAPVAARHILNGLSRRKKRVVFPLSGHILYGLTSWFPWGTGWLQKALLKKYRAVNLP